MTFADYEAYLQSPEWRARREAALERFGRRCATCNRPDRLEVHHRTYERLGGEHPSDLVVLCETCHGIFHNRLPKLRTTLMPRKQRPQQRPRLSDR